MGYQEKERSLPMAHQKRERSRNPEGDPQSIGITVTLRTAVAPRMTAILRTSRTDAVTFNLLVGLLIWLPRAAQEATHKATLALPMRLLRRIQPYHT